MVGFTLIIMMIKFIYDNLSFRTLPNHKLSGYISPDIGKLQNLKILYVFHRLASWQFLIFLNICCVIDLLNILLLVFCDFLNIILSEPFMRTTSMELFVQSWAIACTELQTL